jgi:multiple antibiotic resistance protein
MTLTELAVTAFTTLFIAFGPLETAAVFGGLTAGTPRVARYRLALQAVAIAGAVLFGFAFFGPLLLGALQISLSAFRVAGGVLLLLQSVDLIFAHPTGLSSLTPTEESEARRRGDIAVFPLAFPLIAGPATMTAVMLLMGQTGGEMARMVVVLAALLACLVIAYVCMIFTDPLHRVLGETGTNVVARVAGVILAALAVQFIIDGLHESELFGANST